MPKTTRTIRKWMPLWAKIGAIAPDRIGEQSDDSGGAEDRGEKIEDSGDKTDVATESGLDVGIHPAGQ